MKFLQGVGKVHKCTQHLILQVNRVTKRYLTLKGQDPELNHLAKSVPSTCPQKVFI